MSNRSRVIALILLSACGATTGCGTAWYARLRADPIAAIEDALGGAATVVSLARTGFALYALAEPTAAATHAAEFNGLVGHVERGIAAARGGLRAAADVAGPTPNRAALTGDLKGALLDLGRFLAGLRGEPGAQAEGESGAALHDAAELAAREAGRL